MTDQPPGPSGTFFVKGEKIVLRRNATWIADGIEITHEGTRDLFFKAIQWHSGEKKYCLKVGYETIFIEVEDTAYFVTALDREPPGLAPTVTNDTLLVCLSNFTTVELLASRLSYENGALYLTLDDGQRAKFLSAPYYDLLRDLREDAGCYYLTIAGKRAELLKS